MSKDLIPLADAIAGLRKQLSTAIAEGAGEDLRFTVGPVELELQVVAEREAGGSGKVEFKLFGAGAELGADGKLADSATQTVKLTLTPVYKGKTDVLASDTAD